MSVIIAFYIARMLVMVLQQQK